MLSIVIPVYNNSAGLIKVLKALSNQTFDKERYEVIVVDNGSTEDIKSVTDKFTDIILISENKNLGSPYSARNRGIEQAKGDIIVLLDAKCIPSRDWLKSGVRDLNNLDADIIGGDIKFKFSSKMKAAQVFDSLENIQMESAIKNRGVAKGGNLFIRKKVFSLIGYFPEGVRSGADVSWTKKATNKGFELAFSPEAFVYYPARNFIPLVKKQWRVSKGQPEIWMENGKKLNVAYLVLVMLATLVIAPLRNDIFKKISSSNLDLSKWMKIKVYIIRYIISLIMKFGNIYGYLLVKQTA